MANPPIIGISGNMLPYMSAARRRRALDTVFEMTGAEERMEHEVNKSSEAYWNFIKIWAKGPLPVSQNQTEHSVNTDSVEKLWEKLDARKKAAALGQVHEITVIDVEPSDGDS